MLRLLGAVGRAVEELAGELLPPQPALADEFAQRVPGADMQQVVQLLAEVPGLRLADQRLGGCDQGAGAGEAHPGECPQAEFVEVDEFIKGVVAAAMRVAGPGCQILQLAKRRAPGARSQCRHHLRQRGDGLLAQQSDDRVDGELGGSHSGTIADLYFRNNAIKAGRTHLKNPEQWRLHGQSPTRDSFSDRLALLRDYRTFYGVIFAPTLKVSEIQACAALTRGLAT